MDLSSNKGLKYLSCLVLQIVKENKEITYKDVAQNILNDPVKRKLLKLSHVKQ